VAFHPLPLREAPEPKEVCQPHNASLIYPAKGSALLLFSCSSFCWPPKPGFPPNSRHRSITMKPAPKIDLSGTPWGGVHEAR